MDVKISSGYPLNYNGQLVFPIKTSTSYQKHSTDCNCCCCIGTKLYRYVQPRIPKSFAPIRTYCRSDDIVEKQTIYNRSYLNTASLNSTITAFRPKNSLTIGDERVAKDTTHKLSYVGNWYIEPSTSSCMLPCSKQWFARCPIIDTTTQKYDFPWKSIPKLSAYKPQENLSHLKVPFSKNTTYKLSYYPHKCQIPSMSFKLKRKYEKKNIPIDDCTTYKLSYQSTKCNRDKKYLGNRKYAHCLPFIPMENSTTYRLSYWPVKQLIRKPFTMNNCQNILNAKCQFEDNTTYNMSYIDCGNCKRRNPIKFTKSNIQLSGPLSNDTTHKLSYLGNWSVTPETPMVPCNRNSLPKTPIENTTTQKHDYNWKRGQPTIITYPMNNLPLSSTQSLQSCTVQKLSYVENDYSSQINNCKSFKPIQKYLTYATPTETGTTMKLSYQFIKPISTRCHRMPKGVYNNPSFPCNTTTTYNLSYTAPGKIEMMSSSLCPSSAN